MEWQKIETVDQNDTVDLWTDYNGGERYTDCVFIRGRWTYWGDNGFDRMDDIPVPGKITHWMKIPDPPEFDK